MKRVLLSDLVDIPALQNLMDSFFNLIEVPTALLDLDGNILIASGWKSICKEFHRKNPQTAARCLESDTVLAGELSKGKKFNIYKCKNGLIDVAAPVIIENIHIGNIFTGQFFFEAPDPDFFSRQADRFGFDKTRYLNALREVSILSESQLEKLMKYLTDLTKVIASNGLDRKRLLSLNENLEQQTVTVFFI